MGSLELNTNWRIPSSCSPISVRCRLTEPFIKVWRGFLSMFHVAVLQILCKSVKEIRVASI